MVDRKIAKDTDTKLADLYHRISYAGLDIRHLKSEIERYQKQALGFLVEQAEIRLREAEAKLDALEREAVEPEALYHEHRWSRFFLVTNGNGHVHSSRRCSTCFPTTRYGWLPELSGAAESEAVAEYGEKMCTVCFPTAPSAYAEMKKAGVLSQTDREAKEARDKRQAERAAKAADKAAKAIVDVDGSPLKGAMWTIETVAKAKLELTDALQSLAYFPAAGTRRTRPIWRRPSRGSRRRSRRSSERRRRPRSKRRAYA